MRTIHRMVVLRRVAPYVITAIVAAGAGAGATVAASPHIVAESHAARSGVTAKVTITRSGETWWKASAAHRTGSTWSARVQAFKFIDSGRYRIRVKFFNPLAPDDVRRYAVRVREIR